MVHKLYMYNVGNGGAIAGAVIAAVLVLAITGGVIAVSVLRLKSSQSSRRY